MDKEILLIKSKGTPDKGQDDTWNKFDSDSFLELIDTAEGNEHAGITVFNNLISGIPSPWARAKLTAQALVDRTAPNDQRVIIQCYRHIRSEWRGLLAAYILHPGSFTLSEPIPLTPKNIEDWGGNFNVRSVLGNMLYDDAPYWKHNAGENQGDKTAPMVQLLYYQDALNVRTLVGATSPYTLFFTATNYKLNKPENPGNNDIYWIDADGKFTDPIGSSYSKILEEDQVRNNLKKIVAFLENVNAKREDFSKALRSVLGEGSPLGKGVGIISDKYSALILSWFNDIRKIENSNELLDDNAKHIPVTIESRVKPSGPLSVLFDIKNTYYFLKGGGFSTQTQDGAIEISDIQKLFIDSNYLFGFRSTPSDEQRYREAPVRFLEAKDKNSTETLFLALPFSKYGLNLLGTYMNSIIGEVDEEKKFLRINVEVKNLDVKIFLQAKLDGSYVDILSKEFTLVQPDKLKNVFTWPNFASPIWNQYYYYSEYPTNGMGIKVLPIFQSEKGKVDFENPDISAGELEEMFLVKYPVGKVDTTEHAYEIIRSKYPVYALAFHADREEKECCTGYTLLKTQDTNSSSDKYMRIYLNTSSDDLTNTETSVGIDFGSTNTCAYYKASTDDQSHPIPFSNRRLALVGFDSPSRSLARQHELLFISNEEPINRNGQVKSWLHEHNPLYINYAKTDNELVGGVPVNETNITVKSISENVITTNAGTLCSNMKWLSDLKGIGLKKSYMKTIWLQICADLYAEGKCPTKLYWSYPSAMGLQDINGMKRIYKELTVPVDGVRIKKIDSHTESEAVCSYSLTKNIALNDDRLFLGIDIGGSTTDILIMGNVNNNKSLMTQCSIRMAANHFFKAINASKKFRDALYRFHESKVTDVNVINIQDVISSDRNVYSRSPYYLNNIFDQLNGEIEFIKFYNSLSQTVPFVFTLPAYVTGVLVFYAGMLVKNAIRKNNMEDQINSVFMRYYGKGGRTFEWIYSVYEDEAKRFYSRCFKAGFGSDEIKFKCENVNSDDLNDKRENKSEVAMGLVNIKPIAGIYNSSDDDDDDSMSIPIQFMSEVFGEKGFSYTEDGERKEIDELDLVDGKFFKTLHNPAKFENFSKFMEIYCQFLDDTGIIKDSSTIQKLSNKSSEVDNVGHFFDNDKEYEKYLKEMTEAKNVGHVSYRMPLFIAEGLYYLENVLIPTVFNE